MMANPDECPHCARRQEIEDELATSIFNTIQDAIDRADDAQTEVCFCMQAASISILSLSEAIGNLLGVEKGPKEQTMLLACLACAYANMKPDDVSLEEVLSAARHNVLAMARAGIAIKVVRQ